VLRGILKISEDNSKSYTMKSLVKAFICGALLSVIQSSAGKSNNL